MRSRHSTHVALLGCVLGIVLIAEAQSACYNTTPVGSICKICTPDGQGQFIKCDEDLTTSYCQTVTSGWQTCGSYPRSCPGQMTRYTSQINCEANIMPQDLGSCTLQMVYAAHNSVLCGF